MKTSLLAAIFFCHFSLCSAQFVPLSEQQMRSIFQQMIVDTLENKPTSGLYSMGGYQCPYLLVYSVKEQKFISDTAKFQLLELQDAEAQPMLTRVPVLITNQPQGHPYFKHLSHEQLKIYLPRVDLNYPYIAYFCSQSDAAALSTESIRSRQRMESGVEHNIHMLSLIHHLEKILVKKQDWQVFRYRSEQ